MVDSITTVSTQQAGVQNALEKLLETPHGLAKTPALSILPTKPVDTPEYDWLEDNYAPRDLDDSYSEGADYLSKAPTPVKRLSGNAQISAKVYKHSGTILRTGVGEGSEERRQEWKAAVELRRDMERSVWSTQGRDDGNPRRTASVSQFVKSENITHGKNLTQVDPNKAGYGTAGVMPPKGRRLWGKVYFPTPAAGFAAGDKLPNPTRQNLDIYKDSVRLDEPTLLKLPENVAREGASPNTIVCGMGALIEIYLLGTSRKNRRIIIDQLSQIRGEYFTIFKTAYGDLLLVPSFGVKEWLMWKDGRPFLIYWSGLAKTGKPYEWAQWCKLIDPPRIFVLERQKFPIRMFRPIKIERHGLTGDSRKFHAITEWGTQGDPTAISAIFDLALH